MHHIAFAYADLHLYFQKLSWMALSDPIFEKGKHPLSASAFVHRPTFSELPRPLLPVILPYNAVDVERPNGV